MCEYMLAVNGRHIKARENDLVKRNEGKSTFTDRTPAANVTPIDAPRSGAKGEQGEPTPRRVRGGS